jgi:hypothetical protein
LGSVPDAGRREGLHPNDGPITLRLASNGGQIPGFSRQYREFRRFSPCNRSFAAKTMS